MSKPTEHFLPNEPWKTAPISPTCQCIVAMSIAGKHTYCEEPTAICYPAMSSGWMALCMTHGAKHLLHSQFACDLIRAGEKWEGV